MHAATHTPSQAEDGDGVIATSKPNDPLDSSNNYNGVSIYADTASTTADLDLQDYSANDGAAGVWFPQNSPTVDTIWLNDYYMRGYSDTYSKSTVTHEFGHALGFRDLYYNDTCNEGSGGWCHEVSIMYND